MPAPVLAGRRLDSGRRPPPWLRAMLASRAGQPRRRLPARPRTMCHAGTGKQAPLRRVVSSMPRRGKSRHVPKSPVPQLSRQRACAAAGCQHKPACVAAAEWLKGRDGLGVGSTSRDAAAMAASCNATAPWFWCRERLHLAAFASAHVVALRRVVRVRAHRPWTRPGARISRRRAPDFCSQRALPREHGGDSRQGLGSASLPSPRQPFADDDDVMMVVMMKATAQGRHGQDGQAGNADGAMVRGEEKPSQARCGRRVRAAPLLPYPSSAIGALAPATAVPVRARSCPDSCWGKEPPGAGSYMQSLQARASVSSSEQKPALRA